MRVESRKEREKAEDMDEGTKTGELKDQEEHTGS